MDAGLDRRLPLGPPIFCVGKEVILRRLTLLAALAIALPATGASAQTSGPSISGWSVPEPAPVYRYDPPPEPLPWQDGHQDQRYQDGDDDQWSSPGRNDMAYRDDPVRLRPPPPPSGFDQDPADRSMPPGWSPGFPDNQLGMGHPAPPPPSGIPPSPQTPTFRQPAMEAPGATTAMRSTNRNEAAIQTLLDQGYSRINPVQPDGRGFVTYAERDGVEMRLWVNPDTGEIARLPD
jgi:hypothetical protein